MNGQTNETQWYIARDGKQHGPLTDIEMRTFVAHNYLRASDLIWRPGMAEWQLAPTLFPAVFPGTPTDQPATPAAAASISSERSDVKSPAASYASGAAAAPLPTHSEASEPPAERGLMRRLAIAGTAMVVLGGGALALTTFREPLMRLVTSDQSSQSAEASLPPTADAAPTAAETATSPTTSSEPSTPETATTTTADVTIEAAPPAAGTSPETASVAATPPDGAVTTAASATASDAVADQPAADSGTQVAAVAPMPGFDSSSVVVPTAGLSPPSIVGSAIDARLQKIPAWTVIKKDYPDWYVTNIAAAEQLAAEQKPATEVSTHIAQSLVALRRQNADKALAASSEKLRRVAVAFLDNLKSLRSQSVTACYGFISKGETSPSVVQLIDTPDGATAFHGQIGAIFEAIAEGKKSPTQHAPAVKADYDLLIKELGKLGWKEEDLQVFSNPRLLAKREPERVCSMVQEWFVAHLAVQDKSARDRLLFETLKPVISG